MNDVLIQPFLVGLSTGLFCCVQCLPFAAPLMVSDQRSWRQTWTVLGGLLLGRFVGYVAFGALFGYLGETFAGKSFDLVSAAAMIVLALFLLGYALGWVRPSWSGCLGGEGMRRRTPFLMGLLMGVNVCPPFLVSVAYVFTLHSAVKGMVYFSVFFLATTVYFLPLVLLGPLSRMEEFRKVARWSAVIVGLMFSAYGVWTLVAAAGVRSGI